MPQLTYQFQASYDLTTIKQILSMNDFFGITQNLLDSGFTQTEIEEIKDLESKEDFVQAQTEEKLLQKIINYYKKNQAELCEKQKLIQNDWNKINDQFFENVKKVTEHNFAYINYYAYLNPFFNQSQGMTTKFYEHFPISIKSNLDDNRYISGCELLMSHLWRIDYEIFGNDAWKNKNQYFWGLNEFLSGLILLEIPEVKMIVANNENFDDEKFLFNYPKLHVIKNDVKKLFHERTSFERFMRDCLDFLKEKYPEENIQEFVQF